MHFTARHDHHRASWPTGVLVPARRRACFCADFFLSILCAVLSRLDLLMSSDILLQPPDRKLPLNCPTHCHQADRRDSRTSDKVKVHVRVGAGVGFVEEVDPGQEECWGKENAEGGVLSHGCLAKGRLRYSEKNLTFVNTLHSRTTVLALNGLTLPSCSK